MNLRGLRFAEIDLRDLTYNSAPVQEIFRGLRGSDLTDLSEWFTPVEDQGNLGSCTAHAVVSLFEYYDRRTYGAYTNFSRLFQYKVTRNLMGLTGDSGADLRTAMKASHRIGMCPEKYYPYDITKFDVEPTPFHYAIASNQKASYYVRIDSNRPSQTLANIKAYIRAGLPSCFGFLCYESIDQADATGRIPFPGPNEKIVGAHAIVAAGYVDDMVIDNPKASVKTRGAIKFLNSWGTSWGEKGWGYLPYDYVLKSLAFDFWVLLRTSNPEFLNWD